MDDAIEKSLANSIEVKHFAIKRLFDIFFSLCVLSVGAPLFMGIALLIRFFSPGPVIYAHERIGRGGRVFKCFKFRSMYPDADLRLAELFSQHPELKEEWNRTHKLKKDPRITPIGRLLRKSSLDEMPQFLNVLVGDLSVVGPRPLVKAEVLHKLKAKAPYILSVRPGITGIWQVSGRNNISYEERIALDELYIQKQSFFFDLWLILKTIPAVLFRKGAY
jgi:exopolysaccharide production protein ExoY